MKEGLYVSSFKEVFCFYSGGFFFVHFFLVLAFTTDRKNDNSVTAKLKLPTIKLRRLLLIVSERLQDRLVKITISMPLF